MYGRGFGQTRAAIDREPTPQRGHIDTAIMRRDGLKHIMHEEQNRGGPMPRPAVVRRSRSYLSAQRPEDRVRTVNGCEW